MRRIYKTLTVVALAAPATALAVIHGCGLHTDGIAVIDSDATVPGADSASDTLPPSCDCPEEPLRAGQAYCDGPKCVFCDSHRGECDDNLATHCEADLSTPEQCGRCGHSCLGGECISATCQPLLVASVPAASEILLADGGAVVTARTSGGVYFVSIGADGRVATGAPPGVIATGQTAPVGPSEDGTFVYWSQSGATGSITRALRDGGSPATVIAASSPESTVVQGDYVYWASYSPGTIMRAKRQPLPNTPELISTGVSPTSLVSDGTSLYWVEDTSRAVFGAPVDGGAARTISTVPPVGMPYAMVIASDGLYVVTRNSGDGQAGLFRLDKNGDGGAATQLASNPALAAPTDVAADDKYVYYTAGTAGTVWRLKLGAPPYQPDGGTPASEAIAQGQTGASGIAVDDRAVYWTVPAGLVRLAK